jgi:hypothetical protein
VVIVAGDNGLDEAPFSERAGEGVELGVANLAGICRIRVQVADRNLDDLYVD